MANDITIDIGAKNKASRVMDKVSRDVKGLGGKIGGFARSAKGALAEVAAGFGGVRVAAVAAAAGVGLSIRTFAQFDGAMAQVAAISGATGNQLDSLRDKAKELGSTTQFSASQAAEGMKFLGQAGYSTNEILEGIGPTLSLAAAGALELGQAADIASDVSSAFGLAATDIGRVADVLAVTATSANTNVEMMGETFKYAAPLAKAAGQSLEEMSAAAGLLGNSGIKATVAGTDLKNILEELASSKVSKAFKAMDVTVTDATGNIRPMLDLLNEFGNRTSNLPGAERLELFADLFGRSAKSAIVLADAGGGAIDELRSKMQSATGTADRMAGIMQNSLAGVGTRIKSALEGLSISMIDGVSKSLSKVGGMITDKLGESTRFFDEHSVMMAEFGETIVDSFRVALPIFDLFTKDLLGIAETINAILGPALSWLADVLEDRLIPLFRDAQKGWALMGAQFADWALVWDLAPTIGADGKSQAWLIMEGMTERTNQRAEAEKRVTEELEKQMELQSGNLRIGPQKLGKVGFTDRYGGDDPFGPWMFKKDRTFTKAGFSEKPDVVARESRLMGRSSQADLTLNQQKRQAALLDKQAKLTEAMMKKQEKHFAKVERSLQEHRDQLEVQFVRR
ncbi:phage tail tape measure protein [Roseiconus nitratireducens]|uniref:Phage tail tape measure protein n=1 Tax=Roseiconus nitratireducens TaxID=2605748 RepID=A0A5M6CYT6_9BACT|nr:phage tail tape measure protein [Roseiconus nitratireducens]KAA5540273.1 phage tail tape measure protein [Roseiconus nitratireducens]